MCVCLSLIHLFLTNERMTSTQPFSCHSFYLFYIPYFPDYKPPVFAHALNHAASTEFSHNRRPKYSKRSSPCCLPDWPHTPCHPPPACRWLWIRPSTPASCSITRRDAVEPEAATSTATKHVFEESQTLPVREFLLAGGFLQEVIVCLSERVQETFFNQLVQVLCFPWKKTSCFHLLGRPSLFLFNRNKRYQGPFVTSQKADSYICIQRLLLGK